MVPNKMKKGGAAAGALVGGYDPIQGSGQVEQLNKFMLVPTDKQHLSQSSGFSTFDTFSLKLGSQPPEPLRLDQMVTLAVFKSTTGTIKKMLHGPTLKIYCVKEVPLANRELRQILKEWITKWQ